MDINQFNFPFPQNKRVFSCSLKAKSRKDKMNVLPKKWKSFILCK